MEFTSSESRRYEARENPGLVWRIGYGSDPWAWTDWTYAHDGRFTGRWDSPDGSYRTVYAGQSIFACYIEVLAQFRPDPILTEDLDSIVEDEVDRSIYPTIQPGIVPETWFEPRRVGGAVLTGRYCDVGHSTTISTLRPFFIADALRFGLDDFDSSAIQNSKPRELTQAVGRSIFSETGPELQNMFDGVRFLSRHGNEVELWAIFERSDDAEVSGHLGEISIYSIWLGDPELKQALDLHGLKLE
ncbi:RES domain-containing protein (plasmid) [Rathayibacter sp. VKM Ac-2759]|uniref:RES domain-containing protein n=1 Tax=Rathayibacter sp. VKM Ac-2759 TaxID=2609252 RepID=UPI001319142C|nr:RES domain-containing protein [Rathayibacter sp. VKM Ac-2759]QHC68922.1 RES domain-containing protein [Rathayibacter sp. VKM Ac-2759]